MLFEAMVERRKSMHSCINNMMNGQRRVGHYLIRSFILAFLIVLAFNGAVLQAGTTGKIRGTVKDKETGDPLIGVNVIIEGTSRGAASDKEGFFFITNVPPGRYTVVFSMIGYNTVVVKNLRVRIDVTSEVDVELDLVTLELETVVVTAKRPLIEAEVTNKSLSFDSETIMSLPVKSSQDILRMQTGVVQVQGRFNQIAGFQDRGIDQTHVRGGRNGEISYMVDGMYVEDAIYAGMGTVINRAAIEEMKVEIGGFNAEYGNAQSAVVNIVTKEGTDSYHASFEASTSNWSDLDGSGGLAPLSTPDALRDYSDLLASFSGPVPLIKGLSFFLSGEKSDHKDRVYEFDDITYDSTLITDPTDTYFGSRVGDTTYTDIYGQERRAHPFDSFTGWKAFGFRDNWDWNLKLTYYLSPVIKFNFLHRDTYRQFRNYAHSWRYAMNVRHITKDESLQQGLTFHHQINTRVYYTVNLSRLRKDRRYHTPGLHDDEFGPGLNTSDYDHDDLGAPDDPDELWHYEPEDPDHPTPSSLGSFYYPLSTVGFDSSRGVYLYKGGLMRYWHRDYYESKSVKIALTGQFGKRHEMKSGLEIQKLDIYFREIQLPYLESPYADNYHEYPEEAAFYIQDKLDLDRVILNLGWRADFSDSRGELWSDPKDPTTALQRGKDKWQFSPRLGFGYRITDRTTFHFNYGHFFQIPEYRNLYVGTATRDLTTGRPLIGNPYLQAQQTTQYEFGIRQQVGPLWAVETEVWTKSLEGQSGTINIIGFDPDSLGLYSYYLFDNYDHGTARGIDITIDKRFGHLFEAQVNYTFSRATANRYYSWSGYWNSETAETEPKREILQPYDQTHSLDAWISFRSPSGFGPTLFGIKPLSLWRISFVLTYLTGYPYTPVTGSARAGEPMSARMPSRKSVDMNMFRGFEILGGRFELFTRITNLFDRKNPLTVYDQTGSPNDPGPGASGYSTYFDRPDYFNLRREIDLGIRVSF
tara:strand:- start:18431 stop:21370 length:2940 start_codon:yes stop_codon:yes gene_type:complete